MHISSEALYRTGRAFIDILFLCAGIIKITHFPTLFTIPTTAIFHAFRSADAGSSLNQLTSFLKHVAMLGGLLMIIGAERTKNEPAHA